MLRLLGEWCTSGPDEPVNGDTPCWTCDEEYDDNEGNVVLPWTGNDEPVDSVVRTSGPDEPVNGDTPCWTGDEGYVDYEGKLVLPQTGSDEPIDSVVRTTGADVARTSGLNNPDGSCAEDGQNYESAVALHRTGSDQTYNKVVSIVGPGNKTGSVTDASGDLIVMSSECREVDEGTLDKIRMWEINPQSELKVHYKPSHGVIFCEGVFVTSREQPVFANLGRYVWEPERTHLMVGLPRECTPVVCRDFAPNVDPDLINHSSDLVNRFRPLCMCDGVITLCFTGVI